MKRSSIQTKKTKSLTGHVRKWHRWLGVLIGIQFLAWVLGGLYFSWIDLDTAHGDDLRGPVPSWSDEVILAPIDPILDSWAKEPGFRLSRVEARPLAEGGIYVVQYHASGDSGTQMVNALTGELRGPLTGQESRALASSYYAGSGTIISEEWIENTGSHHEYRELPLPAWVFAFDDARKTRIYVAPEIGRVSSFRNHQWRVFDFLWMLHTMDYAGRDNFNNWILRGFSILGLVTVLSGFWLFFLTQRRRTRF